MQENCVRENVAMQFVTICRVDGKKNIADIFTKEMKDTTHFVELRNLFMCLHLHSWYLYPWSSSSCFAFEGGVSIYFKYCHIQSWILAKAYSFELPRLFLWLLFIGGWLAGAVVMVV